MRSVLWLVRSAALPSAALGLLWFWWGWAQALGSDGVPWWAAAMLLAGFGIAAAAPRVALVLLYGAFALQLVRPEARFDQSDWLPYFVVVLVAIVFAIRTAEPDRRTRLLGLLPIGVAIGLFTNLPALGPAIWTDQGMLKSGSVGLVNGKSWEPLTTFSGWELLVGTVVWTVGAVLLILAGWMVGSTYRSRRLQWAAQADAAAARESLAESRFQLQVREQRDRIAQDVHDITAHSLSVIAAQADGAAAHADEEPARAALSTIATSARQALGELRGLLERLDEQTDGDTAHAAAEIRDLVGTVRATGARVQLVERGTAVPLSRAADLAAYRIAQEALTNALRHGVDREPTRVVLDWQRDGLALSITSSSAANAADAPAGRGIVGMQQRARLAGGWLTHGIDPDTDRYLVTAHLPGLGTVVE